MPAHSAPATGATPLPATAPGLSAAIVAAREKIAAGRDKLRRQHESGSPGVQVCAHFTDLLEGIVVELFHDALSELAPDVRRRLEGETAVVAHSGFGRRAMAPYSDIDVMLLHATRKRDALAPEIGRA